MERRTFYRAGEMIYMRWMNKGKVVRVAKMGGGGCVALYPTNDRERFGFEAFREVDDPGMTFDGLRRDDVRLNGGPDEIWLKLLDGNPVKKVLSEYQPTPMGEGEENIGDKRFSYYFAKRDSEEDGFAYDRHGTFHIVEVEEREAREKSLQERV